MCKATKLSGPGWLLSALLLTAPVGCFSETVHFDSGRSDVGGDNARDAGGGNARDADSGDARDAGGGNASDAGGDSASDADSGGAASSVESSKSALARVSAPSTGNVPALGASNARFAFELYHRIAESNAGKNLIFSPYSISTASAMIYEGARGTTESELKSTLHYDLDKPALHEAFNATALALDTRGAGKQGADGTPFRIHVNNSIWAQSGYPIVPAFLDVMAVNYGAGVLQTDFANNPDGARKAINGWVSDQTEQLFPELLKPGVIRRNTTFVLTNTVYFNAGWQKTFDKLRTKNAPFTRLDGSTVSTRMLDDHFWIPYVEGENYRAITLPYNDDKLRFVAVLPAEGALASVETELSGSWFDRLNSQWKNASLNVILPQLDYEQQTDLNEQLMALGVHAAFGDADFSGLTSRPIAIDAVVHLATLKVFEGGTIAAAVTGYVGTTISGVASDDTIRFDRPFLLAIVDQPTGGVLFLGRVLDPTKK